MDSMDEVSISGSEEECLKDMLGGITFDVAWEEEVVEDQVCSTNLDNNKAQPSAGGTATATAPPAKKPTSNDAAGSKKDHGTIDWNDRSTIDDEIIFRYAHSCSGYCTPHGKMERPPVRVVDMSNDNRGNGLVATSDIPRGSVIFTERAAVAAQTSSPAPTLSPSDSSSSSFSSTSVLACQYCFRSLEPITKLFSADVAPDNKAPLPCADLWPVPPLDFDENTQRSIHTYRQDKFGRIQCVNCRALFCSVHCHRHQNDEYNSCCAVTSVQNALPPETQAPVRLAAKLTCHFVRFQKNLTNAKTDENDNNDNSNKKGSNGSYPVSKHDGIGQDDLHSHFLSGFCGNFEDVRALELGTLQSVCKTINLTLPECGREQEHDQCRQKMNVSTAEEGSTVSLDLFHAIAAKTARNSFGILTQSPFKPYYAALLRQANYSGGRDSSKHQDNMRQIAQAVTGHDDLTRGIDREIENLVAPEIAAVFPLTARCNHSCDPNAQVQSQQYVDAYIDVVALRDIVAGEEILISYIGIGPGMGRKTARQRRRELQAKYLFACTCPLCLSNITTGI